MQKKLDISDVDLHDKASMERAAKYILANLEKGMTIQQATGIDDRVLEEVYHLAYSYYTAGSLKEAACLFQLLASTSPNTYKYVLGLAASYHQIKLFQEAAIGFYIALNIEPDNPTPAYYLLDCFMNLDLKEEAKEMAQLTLELCKGKPEHQELKSRVQLISKQLNAKK